MRKIHPSMVDFPDGHSEAPVAIGPHDGPSWEDFEDLRDSVLRLTAQVEESLLHPLIAAPPDPIFIPPASATAPAPFDPTSIWEALGALAKRVALLEEAIANLPAPAAAKDWDDPSGWASLEVAKTALMAMVTREAARRLGFSVTLYERMTFLDGRKAAGRLSDDQALELRQHNSWAEARASVELVRQNHNAEINKLTDLDSARAYNVGDGWPD